MGYARLSPGKRRRFQVMMQASAALERAALAFPKGSPTHLALLRQAQELQRHHLNPYPPQAQQLDQRQGYFNLALPYALGERHLRLFFAQSASSTLRLYFHPVCWPEHEHLSLAELLLIVLPALEGGQAGVHSLTAGRWLKTEAQQRAAETLVWQMKQRRLSRLPNTFDVPPREGGPQRAGRG